MKKIRQIVNELIELHQTRDPFEIARGRNITLNFRYDFTELKGAYVIIRGNKYIFLNGNIEECVCRYVCAHELGHDVLHQGLTDTIYAFENPACSQFTEKQANLFAAHLLLCDQEMDEVIRQGFSYQEIAREFCVDENLVLLKIEEMRKEGYPYKLGECPPSPYFLR